MRAKLGVAVAVATLLALPIFAFASQATAVHSFFSDLEKIRRASPQLKTEEAQLKSAAAQSLAASLFWTPQIAANLEHQKRGLPDTGTEASQNSVGVSAGWNLSTGGAEIFRMRALDLSQRAQRLELASETLRIESQASGLIFRTLSLKEQLLAQQELLRLKEETFRILRQRYQQGKTPLQEVEKAEVDLSQSRIQLMRMELELAKTEAAVRALFVTGLETAQWPFDESTKLVIGQSATLELDRYRLLSQANEASWKSTRAQHFPGLGATIGYSQSAPGDRTQSWTPEYYVRFDLSIPLWSRYETSARSAAAFAELTAAQSNLMIAERAESENRSYLKKKLELSLISLKESRRNIEKSEKVYRDMLRNFRLGRLSTYELFEEQGRLIDSRRVHAESLYSYHEAVVETCLLNGRLLSECISK